MWPRRAAAFRWCRSDRTDIGTQSRALCRTMRSGGMAASSASTFCATSTGRSIMPRRREARSDPAASIRHRVSRDHRGRTRPRERQRFHRQRVLDDKQQWVHRTARRRGCAVPHRRASTLRRTDRNLYAATPEARDRRWSRHRGSPPDIERTVSDGRLHRSGNRCVQTGGDRPGWKVRTSRERPSVH